MNIAIIGSGYVGLTTGVCLAEFGHKVISMDIDGSKIETLKAGKSPIYEPGLEELLKKNLKNNNIEFTTDLKKTVEESEIIFICVDTPAKKDGHADLRYVEQVARDISQHMKGYKVIVDKSTVPLETAERVKETILKYSPGYTKFDVISNPEFLREGSAVKDTMYPDRIVIGADNANAEKLILQAYEPLIKQSKTEVRIVSVRSAELIKHGANSFLAMKISFANLIAEVCENAGADATEVLEAIGLDDRIGMHFLRQGIGYGGSCFPKDVAAFQKTLETMGIDNALIQAIENINENAWRRFVKKIEKEVWVFEGKTIGILGLAFKPETDDIRNAPALKIIKSITENGAKVKVYDPQAMDRVKEKFPDLQYCTDAHDTAQNTDALVICTEWKEFLELDLLKIKKLMKTPVIFDGRNAFDKEKALEAGFRYFGIGR